MTGNDQVKFPPDNKPVLQFVAIQRRDTGEWAIPGVRRVHFLAVEALVLTDIAHVCDKQRSYHLHLGWQLSDTNFVIHARNLAVFRVW